MSNLLEVIAFNIESCLIAQRSGANRIELCDNPGEGGTTPSYGFIKVARAAVDIDLFPIIRPRGGDFLYSDDEFEIMKEDVKLCKQLGCDGVVVGILNADGTVNKNRTSELVKIAYPLSVTFHRAFDRTKDPFQALEDIIECGCERILTSGQQPTVSDGMPLIRQLIDKAEERIIIMPGSGVRSGNILELKSQTGATEFHSSARTIQYSLMQYQSSAMHENLTSVMLDEEEVIRLVQIIQQ